MAAHGRRHPTPEEILPLHDIDDVLRATIPTPQEQAEHHLWHKVDANDVLHRGGPGAIRKLLLSKAGQNQFHVIFRKRSGIVSAGELDRNHPNLREPVIDGVLRRGEVMNLIAAPKMGKSMLALGLAYSLITGAKWLGKFQCTPGRVLVVDNELHPETIAYRVRKVGSALNVPPTHWHQFIHYRPMRGDLRDIDQFSEIVKTITPGFYALIIMDAFYKFYPKHTDENDNAEMARILGTIDRYAADIESAFVLVHHTSKGSQAGKSITDVGAGAGSLPRAVDAHMVMREHEEPNTAVVDATVRTFAQPEPFAIHMSFPVWTLAQDVDATALKGKKEESQSTSRAQASVQEYSTFEQWVKDNVTTPMSAEGISARLAVPNILHLSRNKAKEFCQRAVVARVLRITQAHKGSISEQFVSTTCQPSQEQPPSIDAVANPVGDELNIISDDQPGYES